MSGCIRMIIRDLLLVLLKVIVDDDVAMGKVGAVVLSGSRVLFCFGSLLCFNM